MGSNINEFIVRVHYDDNGEPLTAIYWDQEGCGHESQFSLSHESPTMGEVIEYHLAHYKRSHHQQPRKRCPMTMTGVDPNTKSAINFRCTLEPHPAGSRHQLEQY